MHPLQFRKLVFNVVSAPPAEVADYIVERFSRPSPLRFGPPSIYHVESGEFDWREAYTDVPEKGWRPLVCILWEPQNRVGHTVFMSNSSDGMSFSVSKVSKFSSHLWCHVSIGDHPSLPWKGASFRYYLQETRREIALGNNERGKWDFVETGSPLPFEEPERYNQRLVRDRLNRGTIYRYLAALGYEAEDEDFWRPLSSVKLWQEP